MATSAQGETTIKSIGHSVNSGLRTPRAPEDASRGLNLDFKVPTPLPTTSEEFIKKFGPLTVEIQQALTAILMLDSPESNVVIESLNALQKFCKKREENKEVYVELGGLPCVQKRMFDSHPVIRRMAMKILALVSSVHKTKLFLRNLNLAKDMLTLAGEKDEVIVEYATKVLSNLATLHTGRLQIIQHPKGLSTLINLFNHNDPDIQCNALETIWQISADPLHLSQFTAKSYVAAILKLVDSEYPPLQAVALMTLERISQRPAGVANLEALGATSVLARKLTNETMVDLHRHCLRIFYHECKDREACRKFAFLAPTIAEIVERTPDQVAKVNGVELLGRLCSLELVSKILAESGMPYLLYNLLNQADAGQDLKEACAFTVAQISRSVFFSKKDFVKCVPPLLAMVNSNGSSKTGVERALVALSSIIEDLNRSMDEFMKARGFDVLRKLLQTPENYSDDAILSALNIIDIMAGNPTQRNAVVQADLLPALMRLMQLSEQQGSLKFQLSSMESPQVPESTLGTTTETQRETTSSDFQASPPSVQQTSSVTPLGKSEILEKLPQAPQDKRKSAKLAMPLLVDKSGPPQEENVNNLEAIPESAEDPSSAKGRRSPPKSYSTNNPQIHTATCSILCSLLCEPSTHTEFSQQNGPEIILGMLAHDEFPVISAGVSIVNACAGDPVLSKDMMDKGLLQAMWKRADLIGINGPLRTAFDRIISTNLPLKYSITGHLSPFEKLQNGFYDMGGLKRREDLKFPQDFTWSAREHSNRQIFLLNLGPMDLDPRLLEKNESLRTMQIQGQDLRDVIFAVEALKERIDSEPFLVGVIAKAVSDRFGGPLDKWRLTANSEVIEVENIQNHYQSVFVPISFLTTGTYRVRALVFKALCDMLGVPCSLETGDYRKTWNVVLLRPDERYPRMCPCLEDMEKQGEHFVYTDSLRRYVVDLVFQPGTLLPLGSFEADTYISSS